MKPTRLLAPALAGALIAAMTSGPALAASTPSLGGTGTTDSAPAATDSAPAADETSPATDGSSPAVGEGSPTPSDGSPDVKDSAPAATDDALVVSRNAGTTTKTYSVASAKLKALKLDDSSVTIIGASWKGKDPELEIRYQDDSGWSSWEEMPVDDGAGPDETSAEGRQMPAQENGTEAVPVVDSTAVEIRPGTSGKGTKDLSVTTVATKVTAADAAVTKKPASVTAQGVKAQVSHHELKANIVTRKEWGADEKLVRCKTDKTTTSKGVFIHHTAGSNSYTKSQAPAIIRGYLAFHTKERGWCDLGYNFLVDKYGTIYEGRAGSIDLSVTGAHASGFNSYTIGISVLGTYTGSAPSTAAQNSVKRLIAWKANQYAFNPTGKMTLTSGGGSTSRYPEGRKVSLNVVSGHRDTSYTACPGNAFYSRLGAIRSGAKAMQSDVGGYPTKGAIGTYYRAHSSQTGEARSVEGKLSNPNGAYQRFAKGTVYWSSKTGAHLNKGGIRNGYQRAGYTKGFLGFPSSDEKAFKYRKSAYYQNFANGMITWSSQTKGQPMRGEMLKKWKALGWERSSLGLPKSSEFASAGKTRQNFEHGYMTYTKKDGVKVYVK
ncbi:N-acetylmuramoyl-L-alanine amidase [Brevibacterium spongiae]|uniref:N-acetylmuramoyl-L-alanine amidase n=1 Tax=Brevibacterium spongiae TaxID=2909672 RepID=A0ABY5SKU4_9MICO|nr:N-acetylmuramoyl-L-alanine amidase [Brevibacterium spongiae]UVI34586.1 N-acetylmuramoyl-L-alanine amidase [Brevibacterium spongiae]